MSLGLPIWEKVPRKRKRADDVGDENGPQVDSNDDADLDAVALGDNELYHFPWVCGWRSSKPESEKRSNGSLLHKGIHTKP